MANEGDVVDPGMSEFPEGMPTQDVLRHLWRKMSLLEGKSRAQDKVNELSHKGFKAALFTLREFAILIGSIENPEIPKEEIAKLIDQISQITDEDLNLES